MSPTRFLAALFVAAWAAPASLPFGAEVERLVPENLFLRTSMDPKTRAYYYAPPAGRAAPGGRGARSGPEGASAGTARRGAEPPIPVILLSGAWGWRPLMQDSASYLAATGRAVLGIDAPGYFKRVVAGPDLASDLRTFREALNERAGQAAGAPILLAGFDYGAEMIPYVLNRAGSEGVLGLLLVAPTRTGSAVYRPAILLDLPTPEDERFVTADEFRGLEPLPAVVVHGTLDRVSPAREIVPLLRGPSRYIRVRGGDHNFKEVRDDYMRHLSDSLRWLEGRGAR
ncbi:MAG: alpha/beta hydrolase family protein [Acidobacteriota bacterium]